jgi:uncharacterized protein (DUF4415 family)
MSGNKPGTPDTSAPAPDKEPWVDPDDAPELDEDFFIHADLYHGETLIRRGRPRKPKPKVPVSIRLSPEVVEAFKADGAGWQTRIDEALKEWLAKKVA